MILIGENLNITSAAVGAAIRERDAARVQAIVRAEVDAGMDVIDLNIGPARRDGEALMSWVVGTVQEVTDRMLSLDTTNLSAMEAGLRVCRNRVLMNSVSLQTSRFERGLELALKYHADVIALLWSNDGMPRDANERAMLAVDFIYRANNAGIPSERIWIDPIVSPIAVDVNQVKACMEFMGMLAEIAPGCRSVVGLSNVSNGPPAHLRGWLNRTYLAMLMRYGLHSAIVDAFDGDLTAIARGRRPDIVGLVHRIMDGEAPDLKSLPAELQYYVKTARVLMGQSVYSHLWLEV
ncbi:MAG: dihydropteroate synthase [Dehalococcoidales bacterium]|nr:dihydropteroate synthase [Dehalococcoidales bacterium]